MSLNYSKTGSEHLTDNNSKTGSEQPLPVSDSKTPASNDEKVIEIQYKFKINDIKGQGLVFGMPEIIPAYADTLIDGVKFKDIFDSILKDSTLNAIMNNRPDTTEGAKQILIAQLEGDLEERTLKTNLANKQETEKQVNELKSKFQQNIQIVKDTNVNNAPQFAEISNDPNLTQVPNEVFSDRLLDLINHYKMLINAIKSQNLFTMGKYQVDVKNFPIFDISNFNIDENNVKRSLAAFLFYVAKTFMRIPIVLLTASTTLEELKNYECIIQQSNIINYKNRLEFYQILKSHIYPSEINEPIQETIHIDDVVDCKKNVDAKVTKGKKKKKVTNPVVAEEKKANGVMVGGADTINTKLIEAINRNEAAKKLYESFKKSGVRISIDMLSLLLINLLNSKTEEYYDYFIIAFCERLIYIIEYWCSPPNGQGPRKTDQKSTKLGNLHFSQISVYIDPVTKTTTKPRYFASILQKIHNTNDNLITFVKIRKGRTTVDVDNSNNTYNDGTTMNIRYSGMEDPNNIIKQTSKLTEEDRTILSFRYDDDIKPFYKDCDRVKYASGNSVTIYKLKGETCLPKTKYISEIKDDNQLAGPADYKHNFNLGPFTYIYTENENNEAIAKSTIFKNKILNQLISGKPVCIIGYGASGSGKTSVLIQLDAPNQSEPQPGLLMYLSNELGDINYTNCSVQIIEFGEVSKSEPNPQNENAFRGNYIYDTNTKKWTGTTYIMASKNNNTCGSMFKDILQFMDYQRIVRKTPNNPESSRTHVIIALTYTNDNTVRKLFICDLAGVENEFNCVGLVDDEGGDEMFLTIPKKRIPCDTGNQSSQVLPAAQSQPLSSASASQSLSSTTVSQLPSRSSTSAAQLQSRSSASTAQLQSRSSASESQPQSLSSTSESQSMPPIFYGEVTKINEQISYISNPKSDENYDRAHIEVYKYRIIELMKYIINSLNLETSDFGIKQTAANMENNSFILRNMKLPLGNYFNAVRTNLKNNDGLIEFINELNKLDVSSSGNIIATGKSTGYTISDYNIGHLCKGDEIEKTFDPLQYFDNKYSFIKNTSRKKSKDDLQPNDYIKEVLSSRIQSYISTKANNLSLTDVKTHMINDIKRILEENIYKNKYPKSSNTYKKACYEYLKSLFNENIINKIIKKIDEMSGTYTNIVDEIRNCDTALRKVSLPTGTHKTLTDSKEINDNNTELPKQFDLTYNFNGTTLIINYNGNEVHKITNFNNNMVNFNFMINYDLTEIPTLNNTECIVYKEQPTKVIKNKIFNFILDIDKDIINTSLTLPSETLIKSLFNIQKGRESTNKAELYKFVTDLKTGFLNPTQNDEYNAFQRQVLLEQLGFSRVSGYLDKQLDTNQPQNNKSFEQLENDFVNRTTIRKAGSSKKQSGGTNDEEEDNKIIKQCNSRTAEGKYINKFLKEMREGIPKYVASINNKKGMPSFFSKCLPLQCNPEFRDCLGINNYAPLPVKKDTQSYGELVDMIIRLTGESASTQPAVSKDIVFCVFCILNLSEPPLVKDPPPVTYFDLTKIQQLYQVLDNIQIDTFRNLDIVLKNVISEMYEILNSEQYKNFNYRDQNIKSMFKFAFNIFKDYKKTKKIILPEFSMYVKKFIDLFSNINAATPIGTVLFTDSVAKNFVEVNTCNTSQSIDYNNLSFQAKTNENIVQSNAESNSPPAQEYDTDSKEDESEFTKWNAYEIEDEEAKRGEAKRERGKSRWGNNRGGSKINKTQYRFPKRNNRITKRN